MARSSGPQCDPRRRHGRGHGRGCYALLLALGLLQLCVLLGTGWRFAAFVEWAQGRQQEGKGGAWPPPGTAARLRGHRLPTSAEQQHQPAYAALSAGPNDGDGDISSGGSTSGGHGPRHQLARHRVAVLLPFLGLDLPPWFRAFADACGAGGSGDGAGGEVAVDWVVLHEGTRCVVLV